MSRVWILGAADPEMEAIEALLRGLGERVAYARVDGVRVHPGNAYVATDINAIPLADATIYIVECGGYALDICHRCKDRASGLADGLAISDEGQIGGMGGCGDLHHWPLGYAAGPHRIDHHRPGDPGYGRPPAEYWEASSLGQVVTELARLGLLSGVATPEQMLIAAADHCLAAAYRGECPGVDPDALMRWRAQSRAGFQRRTLAEVLALLLATSDAIMGAPLLRMGDSDEPVRDMRRGDATYPELPEAACRLGVGYIAGPLTDPDGRRKVTCSGSEGQVQAFLDTWAPSQGLVDTYGDPARGFAGGYLPCAE